MGPIMAEQPFLPFEAVDEPAASPELPTARLIAELARVCTERPLGEKVLVAPSLLVGDQIVERPAREGHPWMNLRVETVRTLAHALVGADLARDGQRLLSRAQALALVEQACAETLKPGSYFGALRDRPGLHRALQQTLEELRAAGVGPVAIPASAFADPRKPREIRAILTRYAAALEKGRYVDSLEVLRRATEKAPATPSDSIAYLLPEGTELSDLERRFLERLAGERLAVLPVDPPAEWTARTGSVRLLRSIGEENEIREVFRRILADGIAFDDVEILHTDASVYPSLVWELSREHEIPCTFSGGIAVTYSRPGQAALCFLQWIADGFEADHLREALASRALTLRRFPGGGGETPDVRAVARALREARVGWGRQRHITALDRLISDLAGPERLSGRDEDATAAETARRAEARARRLSGARYARQFVLRALALAPDPEHLADGLRMLARGTRTFVSEFGRVAGELDAAAKTALETVFDEIAELPSASVSLREAVERLRDAVLEPGVDRSDQRRRRARRSRKAGLAQVREPPLRVVERLFGRGDETLHPLEVGKHRAVVRVGPP